MVLGGNVLGGYGDDGGGPVSRVSAFLTAEQLYTAGWVDLTGWTKDIDDDGDFDAVNGIWTVPETGYYCLTIQLHCSLAVVNEGAARLMEDPDTGVYAFRSGASMGRTHDGVVDNTFGWWFGLVHLIANYKYKVQIYLAAPGANRGVMEGRMRTTWDCYKTSGVTAELYHAENHILSTAGPHTGTLPLADLAVGVLGSIIRRGGADWEELALGAADTVLTVVGGVPVWASLDVGLGSVSGVAFPGAPAAGDLFYRTDLHMWAEYDGVRWLSSSEFSVDYLTAGPVAVPVTITSWSLRTDYMIYVTRVAIKTRVAGVNNALNYWNLVVRGINVAYGVADWIDGYNTAANPPNTWVDYTRTPNITQVPDPCAWFDLDASVVGAPGTLQVNPAIYYKLILT